MRPVFQLFRKDEDGATTVDWVVLTAALIGLGLIVVYPIAYSTDSSADEVGAWIGAWDKTYEKN